MQGLWGETLDRCRCKIRLARSIREGGGDLDRAMKLYQEAREEAEVVRNWAAMTRLLRDAQREAREIP
jgi:hypothetical protein